MIIDLSVTLNERTPVYPGDPQTEISSAGTLDQAGYEDHYVCIGTHIGTHIDAPSHMIADGKNLHEFPIERFTGRGVLIIAQETFDIETLKNADIQEGDIVLFNTGMSDKYQDPSYFTDYPAMSEDIAAYLVQQKVGMVGVDTCSVDNQEGFPIHKQLLAAEVLIIENLTNLKALEGMTFKVHAYPIKLELDGAPARIVAEVI